MPENSGVSTLSRIQWSKPAVAFGDFVVLAGETFAAAFRRPLAWRELIDQIWFVARVSIVPTLVLSIPYTVIIVFTLNIVLIEVGAGDLSGAGAALASVTQVGPVVTAIVLLKAEIHRIPEVAETIAQLPAVSEVYSITGDFDLVAIVRVRAHDDLADVIPGGLNKVDGVTATQTHVAFRAYSRHDLEAAFSIGLADA